jgi:hypothetical protein
MSSDESVDGDDYVVFGTALEPIEEEDVPRKRPVPIEEQVKCSSVPHQSKLSNQHCKVLLAISHQNNLI